MNCRFVSQQGHERLILVFAGWAMDDTPFRHLRREGYDIAVVWDYRDLNIDWSFTAPYCEICVVAWSLGVYASAVSTYGIDDRITRRVAVNGTLWPVDRLRGIPEEVFAGTHDALDSRQLRKFFRRMCGSAELFADFCTRMPDRPVYELRQELEAFYPLPLLQHSPVKRWDVAVIGTDDAIFPAVNQWRAWQGTPVDMMPRPHLIDLQEIIDRYTVDKHRVGSRFAHGRDSYEADAPVQARIAAELEGALRSHGLDTLMAEHGARILEIGCGTGLLSRRLDAMCHQRAHLELWDLIGPSPVTHRPFRQVDAELELGRTPSRSFDIIVSASTVQWFNSPTRFLAQCARILAPGGSLLVSTFVRGNLHEVYQATGRTLPLLSAAEWCSIVPDSFETVMTRDYTHALEFSSPHDVFRHLRGTGVNSLGDSSDSNAARMRRVLASYPRDLDGVYRATYRPFILLLKRK